MKVILIDEDVETYKVLKDVASLSGSEIIHFTDLEEAQKFIEDNLQEIDGIIAETYVKDKPVAALVSILKRKNVEIPFIILTAELTPEDESYLKHMGIKNIMTKPFNPLEVFTELVALLKEIKGEEYVKQVLHEDQTDRNSLKAVIQKIIEFFKKLFGKK